MSEKKPVGRPTHYNAEIADRICSLVSTHDLGLPRLCEKYPDLPVPQTINRWRRENEIFRSKYAQAKMEQAELMAESIEDVAQDLTNVSYVDENGARRVDAGMVAQARLIIDSRKWLASKLAPKIYGDHKNQEPTNPQETLNKIRDMVNDLNKTNASEI